MSKEEGSKLIVELKEKLGNVFQVSWDNCIKSKRDFSDTVDIHLLGLSGFLSSIIISITKNDKPLSDKLKVIDQISKITKECLTHVYKEMENEE